jgi:hypothetical protein
MKRVHLIQRVRLIRDPEPLPPRRSDPSPLDHAERIIGYGPRRAGALLLQADRLGSWRHVDWSAVREALRNPPRTLQDCPGSTNGPRSGGVVPRVRMALKTKE